jgi:type II secretory pathway pseudopilin PulG
MMTLILLGVAVVLLLVIIAMAYRSKAKQAEHYGAIQATIAEAALRQAQHREELDKSLSTLEVQQRQETINETNPQNLARRDGLDNNWSDDDRLHDTTAAANHSGSIAVTDAASAALDKRTRTDLFDG